MADSGVMNDRIGADEAIQLLDDAAHPAHGGKIAGNDRLRLRGRVLRLRTTRLVSAMQTTV
jgi:hypothetical protein